MFAKKISLPAMILGIICSFVLLVGGNWLYQKQFVEVPLSTALSQRSEIIYWNLENQDNQKKLVVELGPADNFRESCLFIQKMAKQYLGEDDIEIYIIDQRNPKLSSFYEDIQFSLYEAIAQGSYADMAKVVEQDAQIAQIEICNIQLDDQNLYVYLNQNNAYLYAVLPRIPGQEPMLYVHG